MSQLATDPLSALQPMGGSAQAYASPTGARASFAFQPFLPKDSNNTEDQDFLDGVNTYLQRGGDPRSLSSAVLKRTLDISVGTTSEIRPDDPDILNDPEKFRRLVYDKHRAPAMFWDDFNSPYGLVNLGFGLLGGIFNVGRTLLGGLKDTALHEWEALSAPAAQKNAQAKQQQARELVQGAEGMVSSMQGSANLILGGGEAFQDLAHRAENIGALLTHDEAKLNDYHNAQSELIRGRLLREQRYAEDLKQVKTKAAAALSTWVDPDIVSRMANVQLTEGERALTAMLFDPLTYLEFGAGKSAQVARAGTMGIARVERAQELVNLAEDTLAKHKLQRNALQMALDNPELDQATRTEFQSALAKVSPQEAGVAAQHAKHSAELTSAQAAVNDELAKAANPSFLRRIAGNMAYGAGEAVEGVSKVREAIGQIPERIVRNLMPNASEEVVKPASETVGAWLGKAAGMAFGAAHGGPLGAVAGFWKGGDVLHELTSTSTKALGGLERDLKTVGAQLALGQQTLPFWRAIAENTTGMTSFAASILDRPLVYAIPDTARAAAQGAAIGAVGGYLQSGGQSQATTQGAGGGLLMGMAGGGLGQIGKYRSPGELRAAAIGDRARFTKALSPDSLKLFLKLHPEEQVALGTWGIAHPDVHVQFVDRPGGLNGLHSVGDRAQVTLNVSGDSPLQSIIAHEYAHHIAFNGLSQAAHDYFLGNPAAKQPGIFSSFDLQGNAITDVHQGKETYVPNSAFQRYRDEYNRRLARDHPEAPPVDNAGAAQEMFAELMAEHMLKTGGSQGIQSLMRGMVVPSELTSENVLNHALAKLGLPVHLDSGLVLPTDSLKGARSLAEAVNKVYQQRNGRRAPADAGLNMTRITPDQWRSNPDLIPSILDGAGILSRDPVSGAIRRDLAGAPILKSEGQVNQESKGFAKTVHDMYAAEPRLEGAPDSPDLKWQKDANGRMTLRGTNVPEEVFNRLRATNQYNPFQVENWRKLNEISRQGSNGMALVVYNTATKGGKYATLSVRERVFQSLYSEITKNGQVVIKGFDPEQLQTNAQKILSGQSGKRLWDGKIGPLMDDIKTYIQNLADGKAGADGIGESKKAVINELFGLNIAANPTMAQLERRPTTQSVIKSLRLDRLNRIRDFGPGQTAFRAGMEHQVTSYAMPRR